MKLSKLIINIALEIVYNYYKIIIFQVYGIYYFNDLLNITVINDLHKIITVLFTGNQSTLKLTDKISNY